MVCWIMWRDVQVIKCGRPYYCRARVEASLYICSFRPDAIPRDRDIVCYFQWLSVLLENVEWFDVYWREIAYPPIVLAVVQLSFILKKCCQVFMKEYDNTRQIFTMRQAVSEWKCLAKKLQMSAFVRKCLRRKKCSKKPIYNLTG